MCVQWKWSTGFSGEKKEFSCDNFDYVLEKREKNLVGFEKLF